MVDFRSSWTVKLLTAVSFLAAGVAGADVLKTSGFTSCADNATMRVDKVNISYDNSNKTVLFDVAGTSDKEQNVTAFLEVKAYGTKIYSNEFHPCDKSTFVDQLCPVPKGSFSAWGQQKIPSEFSDLVPGMAFQIPDIAAQATLRLKSDDTDKDVACIQSQVTNGKTVNIPAISYIAAGIAATALIASGASAIASAVASGGSGTGGSGTMSPSFTETMTWFQGLAMNGMMSVNYPPIYRSFTKNFAFSTGLIAWAPLQSQVDHFRSMTGGNLTSDSIDSLDNTTLVYPDGSSNTVDQQGIFNVKRAFDTFADLAKREFNTGFNTTNPDAQNGTDFQKTVSGIEAFANQLRVPGSDIFMTVLLVMAIVIASIVVFILLFKLILEIWALVGNFPKSLAGFRKHYWGSIGRSITCLILVLYGIWVLYCVFQFTHGDSWAAITLAAVTLALFTGILAFFTWKILHTAHKLNQDNGNTHALYEEKKLWVKYSIFYDSYKKDYWWLFVPLIVYMAAKGAVLAAADGSGRTQTIALLAVETIMLGVVLLCRPFERKSGNVINIVIQVVRVLSVVCILVFVEEFGIQQSTQTVTGLVLIVVQSVLTVVLVVLIIWHAFDACFRANPHRKRRKELEQTRDLDALTPLDARNSLLHPSQFGINVPSVFTQRREASQYGHKAKPSDWSEWSDITVDTLGKPRNSNEKVSMPEDAYRPPVAPSGGHHFRTMMPTTDHDVRASMGSVYPDEQPAAPAPAPMYGYAYQPWSRGGY